MDISLIKSLPNSCVFAVISDSSKLCYIAHTSNLLARLKPILDEYNELSSCDDLRLEILSEVEDIEYKQIYLGYYRDQYINNNYRIVNTVSNCIKYEVKISVMPVTFEVVVYLKSRRGKKVVVGVFSNMDVAKSFVRKYYKDRELVVPVYSMNKRTKMFLTRMKI